MAKETTPRGGSGMGSNPTGGKRVEQENGEKLHAGRNGADAHGKNGATGATNGNQPSAHTTNALPGVLSDRAPSTTDLPTGDSSAAPQTQPLPLAASSLNTAPALLDPNGIPIERRVLTTDELTRLHQARRSLNLKLLIAFLAALLGLVTAFYSPLFDPAASLPPRAPDPVPLSEVQPYGVNTFLQKEVEGWKKQKTLELGRDMGAGWIRQQFPWAEIEYRADPQRPFWDVKNNQNAWDKFDGIVEMAEKYNLRVIARIDNAPVWSHPASQTLKSPPDKAHLQDFANFIEAFVTRYKGRVAAIQIWNEPNLTGEWVVSDAKGKSLPVSPGDYTELLKTAYVAAKRSDPNMIVLAAPLATNNEHLALRGNLNELDYLQGMYDAGAQHSFDVMSANAYGKSDPPEDPPSIQKLNFRRVELLHDVMVKNGDANKAVWFNEYGWNASPPTMSQAALPWGRVTPEQQSDYTVRGIEYARKNWPWAGVFTIWYLRQVGDISDKDSEYYFGMVNPDFVASPLYRAVAATANSVEKVAMPGTWGPLSPPVQAGARWRVMLDPAAPGGMYVAPSGVGDALNVRFTGTDLRVMLMPIKGSSPLTDTTVAARYYVTVDGKTDGIPDSLPRDGQGRAYIDAQGAGGPTEVQLVSGLDAQLRTQQHTLQIKVDSDGSGNVPGAGHGGPGLYAPLYSPPYGPAEEHVDLPGIAAVTVEVHSSYLLFMAVALLLLAGVAFAVWALLQTQASSTRRR